MILESETNMFQNGFHGDGEWEFTFILLLMVFLLVQSLSSPTSQSS